jgi:hypothetical protein
MSAAPDEVARVENMRDSVSARGSMSRDHLKAWNPASKD